MLNDVLVMLRKTRGYTQEDIAEKCGVSRQAVSKWEQGVSVPDIYNCQVICDLYGIDINELLKSDINDSKEIGPVGKYMFGYVKIEEEGYIRLPKECLEKMGLSIGDDLICLGDISQGVALVNPKEYERFAEEIIKAKTERKK